MANGETLQEVRRMLRDGDIDPEVATRATLAMIADLYEAVRDAQTKEDERHVKIDNDLTLLKKFNIILWIRQNKPVATVLVVLLFIVLVFLQDVLRPIIAKALGLPG